MFNVNSNLVKSMATALVSTSNVITTVATRTESIVDNSLGMLDDVTKNGKHYTHSAYITDVARRQRKFLEENSDIMDDLDPDDLAILGVSQESTSNDS